MTRRGACRVAALGLAVALGACTRRDASFGSDTGAAAPATGSSAQANAPAGSATTATASATEAPPSSAPASARAEHGAGGFVEPDPIADELAVAQLSALSLLPVAALASGELEGRLAAPSPAVAGARQRRVRVVLATTGSPRAYRRSVAFYRLAHALGARIVPATIERHLGLRELTGLLAGDAAAIELLRARAAIRNDGTVDATLSAPSTELAASPFELPPGRVIPLEGSYEVASWSRWAEAPAPAAGEDTRLLGAYVELLVLDYLSGNVLRRTTWLDDRARTLVAGDNATAFPLRPDRDVLDRLLRRLRAVARFPRGLRERLAGLDRDAASALLAPGGFEEWLLPPRTLIELDERRTGLLTLIEARVAERGEAAVLCL